MVDEYNKDCKYMRSKYNWTPNDYDLTFPYWNIPPNIIMENVPNLSARLKNVTPLAKTIHLKLGTDDKEYTNIASVVSDLTITNNSTGKIKKVKII